jgi:hypothetical protein
VGEEHIDTQSPLADRRSGIAEFCRAVEVYLCRKNDGHLIRVVGPSFDVVSAWAEQGVPLKIAYAGIDRYFERYYRKGPRRRPVKIDFCEADVLDVFDEWKRAVGVTSGARTSQTDGARGFQASDGDPSDQATRSRASLPAHLERVLQRLTAARAGGTLGDPFDALIDRVSAELDAARARAGGLRGAARQALLDRLTAIDVELLQQARTLLDHGARAALAREADEELAGFRSGMNADAFARAHDAAVDRLVRERFNLPTVSFA